jgi:chromosome segregation ATPase
VKLRSLTVRGFRSFGAKAQTLECEGALTVVFGSNSQGKSSLVEATEFLLTGQTTRSQLHAGSKSEFAGCLRNVHLAPTEEVFVEGSWR